MDERGVHIKTDETAHAAVHVVALKREVDAHALGELHQLSLHALPVFGITAERELDASPHVALGVHDARATREADDGVDVQSLRCYDLCGTGDVAR